MRDRLARRLPRHDLSSARVASVTTAAPSDCGVGPSGEHPAPDVGVEVGADGGVRRLGTLVRQLIRCRHYDEQIDIAVRGRRAARLRAEDIDPLRLESVHPGHTAGEVREATGFDYDVGDVHETAAPSAAEFELLRGPVAAQIAADYPDFAKRVWS